MLLNCGVGEDSLESPELQQDQISQILKEISPEYSLVGLMLKPKLQYFGAQLFLWSNSLIHDYWKNHSFDYQDLCRQSDVSAF